MLERYKLMKAMHTIVRTMNNEDAYYEWINIVPDEADDNELMDIAQDDELFADSCNAFKSIMQVYGDDGFCNNNKAW